MALLRCRIPLKHFLRPPMVLTPSSTSPSAALSRRFSQRTSPPPPPPQLMPAATIVRRQPTSDAMPSNSDDMALAFLDFDEPRFDDQHFLQSPEDQMLFDFDDGPYLHQVTPGYDPTGEMIDVKPVFPRSPAYELAASPPYSPDSFYGSYPDDFKSPQHLDTLYLSNWLNHEPDSTSSIPSPTSPIPIPSASPQSPFGAFSDHSSVFAQDAPFSPGFAAALPLPRSSSPSSSYGDHHYGSVPRQQQQIESLSVSPHETQTPAWATQLWETSPPPPRHLRTPSSPRSSARHSPLGIPARRNSVSSGQLFPSSSAPSVAPVGQNTIRGYSSRRAESFSTVDDRDATVRRGKKRVPDEGELQDKPHESPPVKSMLRPPKLAPSAWQLYFTDWIQRQQASSSRKLNVAQAAKEAGQEYASLSEDEKEPYKRRSQAAKDVRERELNAYMRTLTPDDIKRENVFRSAQRKAGKSRKSNIKDPNAPKKPLSAYFMFLQRIRAHPELVRDIFGDETETTKQSVLAAAKWRSMTDDERKPFLAQAEQEKMEYEAARRLYEDGSVGYGSSINFSILPGSPAFPAIKIESESESEGFATDDGQAHGLYHIRL